MKILVRSVMFVMVAVSPFLLSLPVVAQFQTLPAISSPNNPDTNVASAMPPQGSFGFPIKVNFRSGQLQISDEAHYDLTSQVHTQVEIYRQQLLANNADFNVGRISVREVVIKSRSDAKGSETSNMAISEKRAQALIPDLQQVFMLENLPFDVSRFSAIGLGETESDENACKYVQTYCSLENRNVPAKREALRATWTGLWLATYDFISDLLLPRANAASRTLYDLLFGDQRKPLPRNTVQPPSQRYNVPSVDVNNDGYDDNYFPPPGPQQCTEVTWDENCLDWQRFATVDVVLEFVPINFPSATTLPQVEEPATQEDVTSAPVGPTQNPTTGQTVDQTTVTPAPSTPTTQTPPAKPVPRLKVYGNPL